MQRRIFPIAACVGAAIGLAAAFPLAHAIAATRFDPQPDTVTIDNFTFGPTDITVSAGAKVTWENRDDIPHTVTDAAEPRAFKSAALDTGESFSHVFSAAGTYRYFCSLHPHMQGTVVVK